jgi:peptide-methionine (S)-S-oxide reductase
MQTAYFGGGCFWCMEAIFQRINGVKGLVSGYSNGNTENPTYEEICTGQTGHAEVLKIDFDESLISYSELLEVFIEVHDPTSLNQQGGDVGIQYRSAVFYTDEYQKEAAQVVISGIVDAVTEVSPLSVFYTAEVHHQNYYNDNQSQPYCRLVILPKIQEYFK